MIRYGHKTGLTATHECCGDGTWYVMISEDEMRNTLGTAADVLPLSLCFIHTLVRKHSSCLESPGQLIASHCDCLLHFYFAKHLWHVVSTVHAIAKYV